MPPFGHDTMLLMRHCRIRPSSRPEYNWVDAIAMMATSAVHHHLSEEYDIRQEQLSESRLGKEACAERGEADGHPGCLCRELLSDVGLRAGACWLGRFGAWFVVSRVTLLLLC